MIALFFAGQPKGSVDKFWTSWKDMRKFWGKRSTKIKQQFSLANQLWRSIKTRSNHPWDYRRLNIMSNIWAYHLWLEEGRNKASISLKKRFGEITKWEGKLMSQAGREVLIKAAIQAITTFAMGCFKLPVGLCHDIKAWSRNSGGDKRGREGKSIGWNGKSWLNQNMKEVWGLETWLCLMIPSWWSKLGGSWKTRILYFIKGGCMHAVVFYMGGMC